MSAKWARRGLGLTLALCALAAAYAFGTPRGGDAEAAARKDNPAAEEKACGEGCWLPFF